MSELDIWLDGGLGREIVVNNETILNLNNRITTNRFYKIGISKSLFVKKNCPLVTFHLLKKQFLG
jgi:hypothetical protein